MTAIEIKGLYKEFWRQQKAAGLLGSLRSLYKKQGESVVAVKPLHLSVEAGETLAFIGPNGADSFHLLGRIYGLNDKDSRRRQAELIEWFELKEFFHVPVRKLSLGHRMRCELAAALLHWPR